MIVIPMAGESRRFTEAGYAEPKYRLPLGGRSVFAHAVGSFAAYFTAAPFLFVVRAGAEDFVAAEAGRLGIAAFRIASLDRPTAGQAESVERGLDAVGAGEAEPLGIFNIDTFRPGFSFPAEPWAEIGRAHV